MIIDTVKVSILGPVETFSISTMPIQGLATALAVVSAELSKNILRVKAAVIMG